MATRSIARNRNLITSFVALTLLGFAGAAPVRCGAEELKPATVKGFDEYIRAKEAKNDRELAGGAIFFLIDAWAEPERGKAYAELRRGQIITRHDHTCEAAPCAAIPGGLIHDWVGIVFVPGVSVAQVVTELQDYDSRAEHYQPQVVRSKLLEHAGDDFHVFLRIKRVQIITLVLDTEYDIHYANLDARHATARSYSTRIAEVENAGEPQEHEKPAGNDRGLLWRLYSYWRFYQADGGVYIQCEAISLTRDIPTGLGWLVRPFIEKVPAESLGFTLDATRKAVEARYAAESALRTGTKGR